MTTTPRATRLIILGSTGSIGTQTIEVVQHLNAQRARDGLPPALEIVGLAAGRNAELLFSQAAQTGCRNVALSSGESGAAPAPAGRGADLRILRGPDAAEQLIREVECDIVMAAMVGFAGLPATLAAAQLGRRIALANKETLVAAGELVLATCRQSGCVLLPVDSEHSALWQCLASECERGEGTPPPFPTLPRTVSKIIITASGGPFRTWDARATYDATPEQALKHPTWQMGPKVTIDSASLTNKALEVIEAHWLFGAAADQIDVLVHPQSIVHSLVEYADGSVIAQLGANDMRTPIQYALAHPSRPSGISRKLDLAAVARLDFCPPDHDRFPALGLAYEVIRAGGTSGAVFNAANEAAVSAFLDRQIPFGRIAELSRDALAEIGSTQLRSLADAVAADAAARSFVQRSLVERSVAR